jgi:alpha-glucosidase
MGACILLIVSALTLICGDVLADDWSVRSPGGGTDISVRTTPEDGLQYRVRLLAGGRERVAVDWSALGLVTAVYDEEHLDEPLVSDLSQALRFVSAERTSGDDVYTMLTGKRRTNRAAYTEISLTFKDGETERLLRIDLRAYDDGVAFRYVLPESSPFFHRVLEEKTAFNIGEGGVHWGQPYYDDFNPVYTPAYETFYEPVPTGSSTPPERGTDWGFPSLFEIRGAYVLIHETGLDESYQGAHLAPDAPGGVYRIAPPLPEEAQGFGENFPTWTLPWTMPWRLMIVSDNLAGVAESNLVFHLAQPSRVEDTSWIEPGTASWNWLSDHDSAADLDKLRAFIDLAAEMGLSYTLIDTGWNRAGETPMEDLVSYADARDVGLLFWYNSGGRHNVVSLDPRNRLNDRMERRAEFAKLQKLGVRGVKIDFFHGDKQDVIRLYREMLEDAAEFHLLVNFHGCTIPRGWQRTFPNLMTMEAVRGAEFYSFPSEPDYGPRAPVQNTVHPFLRNVIGSMDYTPTHFSRFVAPRITTNAHEIALAVIFESGIVHLSDNVAAYRNLPDTWRKYLGALPTAWGDTRLLSGGPGEHVVLARRSGRTWYIAGINGENAERKVDLDLSLLRGLGDTMVTLFDDRENGFGARESARTGDHIRETMQPYGGFVIVVEP